MELIFTDYYEKKTQLTLELMLPLKAEQERSNSPRLYELLSDLNTAIDEADLTEIQRYCLRKYYIDGLTQQEIADSRGVHKSSVNRSLKSAVIRLSDVFRAWDYWTEGERFIER